MYATDIQPEITQSRVVGGRKMGGYRYTDLVDKITFPSKSLRDDYGIYFLIPSVYSG